MMKRDVRWVITSDYVGKTIMRSRIKEDMIIRKVGMVIMSRRYRIKLRRAYEEVKVRARIKQMQI